MIETQAQIAPFGTEEPEKLMNKFYQSGNEMLLTLRNFVTNPEKRKKAISSFPRLLFTLPVGFHRPLPSPDVAVWARLLVRAQFHGAAGSRMDQVALGITARAALGTRIGVEEAAVHAVTGDL